MPREPWDCTAKGVLHGPGFPEAEPRPDPHARGLSKPGGQVPQRQ